MPVLNIKDSEAHRLASDLAAATGKSLTRVVVDALKAETQRTRQPAPIDRVWLKNLQDRVASKLDPNDHRTPDEVIGYDENGLPQ